MRRDKGPSMVVGRITQLSDLVLEHPGINSVNGTSFGKPAVGDLDSAAKGSGARFNAGKPRMDLLILRDSLRLLGSYGPVPAYKSFAKLAEFQATKDGHCLVDAVCELYSGNVLNALREASQVFEYGANKYAAWNWAKGMPWSVPLACAVRHLLSILDGKSVDQESGLAHAGHVVCNVLMLIHYDEHYLDGDDLPSPELFK